MKNGRSGFVRVGIEMFDAFLSGLNGMGDVRGDYLSNSVVGP